MPRLRRFYFTRKQVWPASDKDLFHVTNGGKSTNHITTSHDRWRVAQDIMAECAGQPARILRAIKEVEAATQWCRDRAAGRARAAEEIVRQQGQAASELATILVAAKLQKGAY
jgi:hypothetical protein